jgi:hypothetical protein
VITVRDHGFGGLWYLVAAYYPTALQAKTAWEHAERKLIRRPGDEGIGVYRLGPNPESDTWESGAPADAHAVVAVTLNEPTARKAERLLRGGTSWTPTDSFADALILRRAKVVTATGDTGGRLVIRRPEGRGGHLTPEGDMREQAGEG